MHHLKSKHMEFYDKQKAILIEYIDNKIDNSNKILSDLSKQLETAKDDEKKVQLLVKMRFVNRYCNSYNKAKDKLLEAFETEKELTDKMKSESF